jgi:hypothetical protein
MRKIFDKNGANNGIADDYLGGAQVLPDELIVGRDYLIKSLGDTDWASVGATDDEVNAFFTCTAVGASGTTGKARTADGMTIRIQKLKQINSDNTLDSTAWPQYKAWADDREVTSSRGTLMDTVSGFKNYFVDDGDNITTYKMWEKPMLRASLSLQSDAISSTDVANPLSMHYPSAHGYVSGDRITLDTFNKSYQDLDNHDGWFVKKIDDDTIQLSKNSALTDLVGFDTTTVLGTHLDTYNHVGNQFHNGIAIELDDHEFVSAGDGITFTNATKNGGGVENTLFYIKPTSWNPKRVFLYHDQALTNLVDIDDLTWETGTLISNVHMIYKDNGQILVTSRLGDNELTVTNTTAVTDGLGNTFFAANTSYYLERDTDSNGVEVGNDANGWSYNVYSDIERTTTVDFNFSGWIDLPDGVETRTTDGSVTVTLGVGYNDGQSVRFAGTKHNILETEIDYYLEGTSDASVYKLFNDVSLTSALDRTDNYRYDTAALIYFEYDSGTSWHATIERSSNDRNYNNKTPKGLQISSIYDDSITKNRPFKLVGRHQGGGNDTAVNTAGLDTFMTTDTEYFMDNGDVFTDLSNTDKLTNSTITSQLKVTGSYDPRFMYLDKLYAYDRPDKLNKMNYGIYGDPNPNWTAANYTLSKTSYNDEFYPYAGRTNIIDDGFTDYYKLWPTDFDLTNLPNSSDLQTDNLANRIKLNIDISALVGDAPDGTAKSLLVRPQAGHGWFPWSADVNRDSADAHNQFVALNHIEDDIYEYTPYSVSLGAPYNDIHVHSPGADDDLFVNMINDAIVDNTYTTVDISRYTHAITDNGFEYNKLYKIGLNVEYDTTEHNSSHATGEQVLWIYGMKINVGGNYFDSNEGFDDPWVFFDLHNTPDLKVNDSTTAYVYDVYQNRKNPKLFNTLHDHGTYIEIGDLDNTIKRILEKYHQRKTTDTSDIDITLIGPKVPIPVYIGDVDTTGYNQINRKKAGDGLDNISLHDMSLTVPKYKSNRFNASNPFYTDSFDSTRQLFNKIYASNLVITSDNTNHDVIDKMGTPFIYVPKDKKWCTSNIVRYHASTTTYSNGTNEYDVVDGLPIDDGDYMVYVENFEFDTGHGTGHVEEDNVNKTRGSLIYPVYATNPIIDFDDENEYYNTLLSFNKVTIDDDDYWLVPAPYQIDNTVSSDTNAIDEIKYEYMVDGDDTVYTASIESHKFMLLHHDEVTPGHDVHNKDYYYDFNENNDAHSLFKMIDICSNDNGTLAPIPTTITFNNEYINSTTPNASCEMSCPGINTYVASHDGWVDIAEADQIPLDIGFAIDVHSYSSTSDDAYADQKMLADSTIAIDPVNLAPYHPGKVDVTMTYYPATSGSTYLTDYPYKIDTIELVSPGNTKYSHLNSSNVETTWAVVDPKYYWRKNIDSKIAHHIVAPDIDFNYTSNRYIGSATHRPSTDAARFKWPTDILIPIESIDDQYTAPSLTTSALEDVWDTEDQWTDQGYDKTKYWPDHVVPASAEVTMDQPSSVTMSQSGTKYVKSAGFTKWEIALDYPPMSKDDFAPFNAVVQAVRGQYTPLYLKLKYNGSNILFNFGDDNSTTKPRIARSPYEDDNKVLFVEGFESNEENVFKQGEVILTGQDNGSLQTVLHDVKSNAFGEAKVRLAYPSDVIKAVGKYIYKNPSSAIVTLAQDSFTYSVDTAGFYRIRVKFTLDDWK